MSKGLQIYLAGPITGLTYEGSVDWREQAKQLFCKHAFNHGLGEGFKVYCPMRGYESLKGQGAIGSTCIIPRHVMSRDHHDCVTADVVLAYLPESSRISIGTVMEMAWCYEKRIPLVVVTPADSPYAAHPMVADAIDYREDTIGAGVERVVSILLP